MTQTSLVLAHLRTGASLTPREASAKFNCDRLAPRILELKQQGYHIQTTMVRKGKKAWASYTLQQPLQYDLYGETRVGIT